MENSELKIILEKYKNGTATERERAIIEEWYLSIPLNAEVPSEIEILNSKSNNWKIVESKTRLEVASSFPIWSKIATIAAAVTAIAFGIYFFTTPRHLDSSSSRTEGRDIYANDVAPGKQGATLTLANGKTIKLSNAANGKLAQQAGITINKSANGQLTYVIPTERSDKGFLESGTNTLTTANGETYQVRLPDGTLVWLNSASSLTYTATLLAYGRRVVELSGEAYFEVAKDKAHPFIVKTDKQEVEVLGTHFNVNSYQDEASTKTTLLEGRVQVSSLREGTTRQSQKEAILKPGEQSIMEQGGVIKISTADLEEATAWKDGDFIFNDDGIETVMQQIARWYDVEVVYQGKKPTGTFYVHVSRNTKISEILKALELTKLVHFKVEGRRVLVTR